MTVTDPHRPAGIRALAVLGIFGGLAVLVAFIADLSAAQNAARILLFLAGGPAVVLAAYGPQAEVSRRLALVGAVPLIAANAALAMWELLSLGRDRPFAGDFGLAGFWAGIGLWVAHAWYGLVAMRVGVLWRWAALILVVGSLLAITGIDRLELTSPRNPTIFGPLSQLGIALNGIAWVLLGIEVVMPGLRRHRLAAAAPGARGNA